jgi:RNA polymerase sigma-70 factor (ECF subfamily)
VVQQNENERTGAMPVYYRRPIPDPKKAILLTRKTGEVRRNERDAYEVVARDLPFLLNDFGEINKVFSCWHQHRERRALELVDTWTYSFVGRYLTALFEKTTCGAASDLDQLVARTLFKIIEKRETIRDPGCYAAWVVIVCKNQFNNYVRIDRTVVSLEWSQLLCVSDVKPEVGYDTVVVRRAVAEVIANLPPFLKEVAQLRFVEQLTYRQISTRLEKPVTTVRTYVCRIKRVFTAHPVLAEFKRAG